MFSEIFGEQHCLPRVWTVQKSFIVNQTHLVQVCGKLVLQKNSQKNNNHFSKNSARFDVNTMLDCGTHPGGKMSRFN